MEIRAIRGQSSPQGLQSRDARLRFAGVKLLLALDQGTTSSRAILFDKEARAVASDQREFPQIFPRPGWVEHDAEAIWRSQREAIAGAMRNAEVGWDSIAALGLTNQRETVVAWDARTSRAVGNAIVWQDRRTADDCEALKQAGHEAAIQAKTGLRLDPYFSATKMRWILRERPEARALADQGHLRFGTIDSWLVWRLSGGQSHVTDASNASRTLLMDLNRCAWDPELLDLFGIPEETLPRIVDSSGELAWATTLADGQATPISGIAGDQQAALFGQLCFEPGMAKCTYGTGCFVLMQVGESPVFSRSQLLSTVAWRIRGETDYALEGSVFIGGAAVQWLRDELGLIETAAEVESLAEQVDDSGGVVVVPAFAGLGAPHWDPYARGAILGLTRDSSPARIARATLEGIAFQVADVIGAMEADCGRALSGLRVDGGASANDLLMRLQADFSGSTVTRPQSLETTALGAAFLAGLAVGFWPSREALRSLAREDASFEPQMGAEERGRRVARWRKAVQRCRDWERD